MVRYTVGQRTKMVQDAAAHGIRAATRIWGCSRRTIRRQVRLASAAEPLDDSPRAGKRKTSERERRLALRYILGNQPATFTETRVQLRADHDLDICEDVLRSILKASGRRRCKARRKMFLTPKQKRTRLAYARAHRDTVDWRRVIAHDESTIKLSKTTRWVSRGPHEVVMDACLQPKFPQVPSVLVWAGIWHGGRTPLVFLDTSESKGLRGGVTAAIIKQQCFEGPLLDAWKRLRKTWYGYGKDGNYILQDNNSVHTGGGNSEWAQQQGMAFLPHPAWSPDLNPIEHVWRMLKRLYSSLSSPPKGKEAREAKLQELWESIPQGYIDDLMDSMPRRLQAVIDNKGGATTY